MSAQPEVFENIFELLSVGDVVRAREEACSLELKNAQPVQAEFYALLMLLDMALIDMNGARHSWLRASEDMKETPLLSNLVNIATSHEDGNLAKCYELLSSTTWPEFLRPVVTFVHRNFQKHALSIVEKCYDRITLTTLAQKLDMKPQDCVLECEKLGWYYIAEMNCICPSKSAAGKHDIRDALMKELSSYTELLERRALKAEVPTGKEARTSFAPSK